jgi:hypothetical protein
MKPLCFLAVFVFSISFSLQAQQKSESPQAKVMEFHQLAKSAKAMGMDTSAEEALELKSRNAARAGKREEAVLLLEQALKSLRERTRIENEKSVSADSKKDESGKEKKPVFVLAFTHHYAGPGGYYAPAAEVRKVAEIFHDLKIPGTLFFDGILVERILKEEPSVFKDINDWRLSIGYHGEETHGPYPVPSDLAAEVYNLKAAQGYKGVWSLNTGKPWKEAVQQVTDRYSHALPWKMDEKTGMLERREPANFDGSKIGGLALVQKTFGRDVSMMPSHALESAPEGFAFRKMSSFTFDQPAMPTASHALRIFRIQNLEDKAMSIAGDNISIYWFMGRLTCKGDRFGGECGGKVGVVRNSIENLERSEPRLVLMGLSHVDVDEVSASARYLNREFFPTNPGSCWVSPETLPSFFEGEKEYSPNMADLRMISERLLSDWKGRPPGFIDCDGRRISLCDAFEGLASGLSSIRSGTAKDRDRIKLFPLYGPLLEDDSSLLVKPVNIPLEDIVKTAVLLFPRTGKIPEDRFIPKSVKVSGYELNPAEFLFAMAKAYLMMSEGKEKTVALQPSRAFPAYADTLDLVFKPSSKQPLCYTKGQLWTVKAARLKGGSDYVKDAVPEKAATAPDARKIFFVFSSNLESSSGGACRDDIKGADLYSAVYRVGDVTVSNLRKLTTKANEAEWFPVLAPEGDFILYNRTVPRNRGPAINEIRYVRVKDGTDNLLLDNARFPSVSKDGRSIVFSMSGISGGRICRTPLVRTQNRLETGDVSTVADSRHGAEKVEDPSFFPDAGKIAFHLKEDKKSAAALGVISVDGTAFEKLTPDTGFGHASVSPDGDTIACTVSRSGRLAVINRGAAGWGRPIELDLSTEPSDYLKYDGRFKDADKVAHSYVEWADSDLLFLSSHGADASGKFLFSKIFLVEFRKDKKSVAKLHDLSGAIEKTAGKNQKDFCTSAGKVVSAD